MTILSFFNKKYASFAITGAIIMLLVQGCNSLPEEVNNTLMHAGKNRGELEKVIEHYQKDTNPQKLKAAYFLLQHMAGQYHYQGEMVDVFEKSFDQMDSIVLNRTALDYTAVWDSLQPHQKKRMRKIYDVHILTSEFLIENIERSFQAWEYPWAKEVSFEEFCNYILPYKLRNEKPENWKGYFQEKYRWVRDSLDQDATLVEACSMINQEMARWFYITKLNCPFDLSFTQMAKLKSGRCSESTQMAAYAMRSMGIPVTLEHVPSWANRNSGHDWNGLIVKNKTIPFLGTEIDPGLYKIEFPMPGSLRSKRAKIFRRTFEIQKTNLAAEANDLQQIPIFFRNPRFRDVTDEYVPVGNATVQIDTIFSNYKRAFLCVFNDLHWEPIAYGDIQSGKVNFTKMGTGIVYLPAVYDYGAIVPINSPFVLEENGTMRKIEPDTLNLTSISISKKYPVREDNEIQPGEKYESFYWNNKWVSLGTVTATAVSIEYSNVPRGSLLWVHKINKGIEERIFTIENDEQIWW